MKIDFDEYEDMYKRIISKIQLDNGYSRNSIGYYKNETSVTEPLLFRNELNLSNTLYVNEDYFINNTDKIRALIIDTINSTVKQKFQLVDDCIMNDEIFTALANNPYIKEVKLPPKYILDKEQLELLLNSGINNILCSIDFDRYPEFLYNAPPKVIFLNYPLIGHVSLSDFIENHVELEINKELSPAELEHLKKLFEKYPQEKVKVIFREGKQIKEVLSLINSNEIILINNKEWQKREYDIFNNIHNNINIEIDGSNCVSPKTMLQREQIFELIINDMKSLNLSPLEEYMYLYNTTKMLKEYKEEDNQYEDCHLSRYSAFTLFNEYMVCAGYCSLLSELVDRLGSPNLSITTYLCRLENGVEVELHDKCLVKIKDDKYDVDGLYISDPTWDSVEYYATSLREGDIIDKKTNLSTASFDFYNHFLMTKEEMMDENIEYPYSDITDVLFKKSNSARIQSIKEETCHLAGEIIRELNKNGNMSQQEIDNVIENIKQSPISGDVIKMAVRNLYSKIYHNDENKIDDLVEQTMYYNLLIQKNAFNNTKDRFDCRSKTLY